jgi:hypothetical protein
MLLRDRAVGGGCAASAAGGAVSRAFAKECRARSRSIWNACLSCLAYLMPHALHNLHMRACVGGVHTGEVSMSHLPHE